MATDCEQLSSEAQEIFKKLQPYFPPDPWKNPRWYEQGIVEDNGKLDLRKSTDRNNLIQRTTLLIGKLVENRAGVYHHRNGSFEGFEIEHFGAAIRERVELLKILNDLDFQIETGDLLNV